MGFLTLGGSTISLDEKGSIKLYIYTWNYVCTHELNKDDIIDIELDGEKP